jgi:glycosyltransferase involved in cell wall biosynthesis
MATRNGEKFIQKQLASILPQLGPDDELVISDDSSTDRTVEIINSFADPRIRLLKNNTFYNPIFNAENALSHAQGGIIVLADQDDVWLDGKLRLVRERLGGLHGRVRLLMMDGENIDEHDALLAGSIFDSIGVRGGVLRNIYDNKYVGCCLAFTRELLEIALPFPKRIPMHDMWLGILAELFGEVEFVRERTIRYRRHPETATSLKLRFLPWTQINRRLFLTLALAKRVLGTRYSGKAGKR